MADAAALTAVSDGVADEVVRRFGVDRPTVVLNCPPAWHPDEPLPARTGRLRALAGVPPDRPIVLYQGGFSVDRGIEELVAALDEPPLRDLDLAAVFVGYGRLHAWLRERASAARDGRIVVVDAIEPGELLDYTVDADVGYVGQPGRTLNQRLNLANKFFEYLQTGGAGRGRRGDGALPGGDRAGGRALRRHRAAGDDRRGGRRTAGSARRTIENASAGTPGRWGSRSSPGSASRTVSSSGTGSWRPGHDGRSANDRPPPPRRPRHAQLFRRGPAGHAAGAGAGRGRAAGRRVRPAPRRGPRGERRGRGPRRAGSTSVATRARGS